MKASRFLRGLGFGLLAAAVIAGCVMLVQSGRGRSNTDQKDKDLTMTETPLEQNTEDMPSAAEEITAEPTPETAVTETPAATEDASAVTAEPTADAAETPSPGDVSSTETAAAGKKTIEIKRGSDSMTVAKKLEEEGIIDDAEDFNQFLEEGGYSTRIIMGTYELTPGESYESLAKKIAGESK